MLAPALAEILRQRREALNGRFAAARRVWPHLDAANFTFFLRDQLSPLVESVERVAPAFTDAVALQGYELGLQLVAEKIAGPAATEPTINRLWQNIFPALVPLVAPAPRRVLGSLCNAAHQLAHTPGAQPSRWRERLAALGPRCADEQQLLRVAQLLAWRSGLAHYRVSALAAARELPPPLALSAVNAPANATWSEVAARHLRDPWFGFDFENQAIEATPFARRVGAFRGFGGLFSVPPTVAVSDAQLLVRSGDEAWVLIADAFGATFHRASPAELAAVAPSSPPAPTLASRLPAGHRVTSVALLPHTFALTSAYSHAVWIGPLSLA
jgi:hypothetical protein